MLTEKEVKKFQEIFKKEYDKEMTYKEAEEAANNLICFFSLLLKIDRRNKANNSLNTE